MAGGFCQPRHSHPYPSSGLEGVSDVKSWAMVLGFPAPRGGSPTMVPTSAGCFCDATLGEDQEEFSLRLCTCESLEKGESWNQLYLLPGFSTL